MLTAKMLFLYTMRRYAAADILCPAFDVTAFPSRRLIIRAYYALLIFSYAFTRHVDAVPLMPRRFIDSSALPR